MKHGPLLILSGPSGVGKSTVLRSVQDEYGERLHFSVSVTTRAPRPGEVDGKNYQFWTPQRFIEERDRGGFLEWAEVHGNYYGTLASEVLPYRERGTGVWLEIDVQGWKQVKARCPDAVSIFLMTSSPEEYERRLRARRTESEEALQRRLANARAELAWAPQYDFRVYNDDLDHALAAIKAIIKPYFDEG